jgi:hypothetical protein
MTKSIIYYTDNRLDDPIASIVQNEISKSELPIFSASLRPLGFGQNVVLDLSPGYIAMIKQITIALESSSSTYVFFCEHDCLYPLSHFDFIPPKDNVFYYNANVWRWKYPENLAITYDRLISLSGLCVNREFALEHYQRRLSKIEKMHPNYSQTREPLWARRWGYEPGTKKTKRGGFSNDEFETWQSAFPIIDIRHGKTFSQSKVTLDSFKHQPINWRQSTLEEIPGWDLAKLFNLML